MKNRFLLILLSLCFGSVAVLAQPVPPPVMPAATAPESIQPVAPPALEIDIDETEAAPPFEVLELPPTKSTAVIIPNTGKSTTRYAGDTNAAAATPAAVKTAPLPLPPAPVPQPVFVEPTISERPLPGLGLPPGAPAPQRPLIARSDGTVNEIVFISQDKTNRISTPFSKPKVIDSSGAQIATKNGNVFLTMHGDPKKGGKPITEPIGIFITEDTPDSPVIAMTLVPRPIIGQTIVVQIEGYDPNLKDRKAQRQQEEARGSDYENHLIVLLRAVARSQVPAGYTEEKLNLPLARIGEIDALPEKRYSGTTYDIYQYRLRNSAGRGPVTLSEPSFYKKGVRAVALHPLLQIQPGQETSVFIITGKEGESARY